MCWLLTRRPLSNMKLLFVLSFVLMTNSVAGEESIGECLNELQANLESDVDRACSYFEDYVKCIIRALDLVNQEGAEEALDREQSAINGMIRQFGCEVNFHEIFREVELEGDSYSDDSDGTKPSSESGKNTIGDCLNIMQDKVESDPYDYCQSVEDMFKCYIRNQDILDKEDAEEVLASEQDNLNSLFGQFGCSLDFQEIFKNMKEEENDYKEYWAEGKDGEDEYNGYGTKDDEDENEYDEYKGGKDTEEKDDDEYYDWRAKDENEYGDTGDKDKEDGSMPKYSVFTEDRKRYDSQNPEYNSVYRRLPTPAPQQDNKACNDNPTCSGFATSPIGWLIALMTCILFMLQL